MKVIIVLSAIICWLFIFFSVNILASSNLAAIWSVLWETNEKTSIEPHIDSSRYDRKNGKWNILSWNISLTWNILTSYFEGWQFLTQWDRNTPIIIRNINKSLYKSGCPKFSQYWCNTGQKYLSNQRHLSRRSMFQLVTGLKKKKRTHTSHEGTLVSRSPAAESFFFQIPFSNWRY